jgi:hypothetical protein
MFFGDDDELPEQFKEKTYPADLHRTQAMRGIAEHYVAELDAQFQSLNEFVKHAGEIGRAHESYIRGVIGRFLPRRWKIGSGPGSSRVAPRSRPSRTC